MLTRQVADVQPPDDGDREGCRRRHGERRAPAVSHREPGDQRPGRRRAEGEPGVLKCVGKGPAGGREPVADRPSTDDREEGRLDNSHQESQRHQGHQHRRGRDGGASRNQAHQQGEHAPLDRDQRQRAPRPEQVAEHAAGKLEDRVAPRECAEDESELEPGQPQLGGHRGTRHRQVAAEQVGHEARDDHQSADAPADGGGA
jgi:hypothetical protein